MDIMRQWLGPFEVPLADGESIESQQVENW
jgi:hypothetical protein